METQLKSENLANKITEPFDITFREKVLQRLIVGYLKELKLTESLGKLIDADGKEWLLQLQNEKILIWVSNETEFSFGTFENNQSDCEKKRWLGLKGWRLPLCKEMVAFAINSTNPLRGQRGNRLNQTYSFLVHEGYINLDNSDPQASAPQSLVLDSIVEVKADSIPCASVSISVFSDILLDTPLSLIVLKKPTHNWLDPLNKHLINELMNLDYQTNRLPKIDQLTISDINKGLWEFWGSEASICNEFGVRPRNPALDIRAGCIAIDFGTSSTVVACESDNGRKELMRVGVRDFYDPISSAHFENPTVLEIVSLENILAEWNSEAYRPQVLWDDVHCSHEARTRMQDSHNDTKTVSSILTKLKQWALRQSQDLQVVFTDQQDVEHTLQLLTQNTPACGQLLQVDEDYPFDPIELYAWFLGMTINWRGRGIYLEYFMTFPVEYPKSVKEKILASFKRGLQRSLPITLVTQHEYLNRFHVEELASEPAAYAVCALHELGLQAEPEGTAYAVFDFGGGTTDFDFGFYRSPTEEEEDEGYERVFEHFSPAGDKFLGGENLLENMAYRVFIQNLEVCQKNMLAFTRPLDAEPFPGSEIYLDKTQAAYSNTLLLVSKLRDFWEKKSSDSQISTGDETKSVSLFNREGELKPCDFIIPYGLLDIYIKDRIGLGIDKFVNAMEQAFTPMPSEVHILLAGNASRSRWITELFGLNKTTNESRLLQVLSARLGNNTPEVQIHPPLESDESKPYKPTAKTGVALGLLDLRPGSVTKVINRTQQQSQGEAGFSFYLGRMRKSQFLTSLSLNAPYQQWHELGPLREGVFELLYTQSPLAQSGDLSATDNEVKRLRLSYKAHQKGDRFFAKAIAPNEIEVALAASIEDIESQTTQLETIVLR